MRAQRYLRLTKVFALCSAPTVILQAVQLPVRTYTVADGLAANGIGCVVRDSPGFIWFCTTEGLSRFDGYQFRNFSIDNEPPGSVRDFLETGRGEYWVATAKGVYRFQPAPFGQVAIRAAAEPAPVTDPVTYHELHADAKHAGIKGICHGFPHPVSREPYPAAEWLSTFRVFGTPEIDDHPYQPTFSELCAIERH